MTKTGLRKPRRSQGSIQGPGALDDVNSAGWTIGLPSKRRRWFTLAVAAGLSMGTGALLSTGHVVTLGLIAELLAVWSGFSALWSP